jgi:hypothetical protein
MDGADAGTVAIPETRRRAQSLHDCRAMQSVTPARQFARMTPDIANRRLVAD